MTDSLLMLIASEFPAVEKPTDHKKRCTRCEEWKPFDQFYPRWAGEDPALACSSMCKPCYKATYIGEYRKSLRMKKAGLLT